jgi:hypothetical protein
MPHARSFARSRLCPTNCWLARLASRCFATSRLFALNRYAFVADELQWVFVPSSYGEEARSVPGALS